MYQKPKFRFNDIVNAFRELSSGRNYRKLLPISIISILTAVISLTGILYFVFIVIALFILIVGNFRGTLGSNDFFIIEDVGIAALFLILFIAVCIVVDIICSAKSVSAAVKQMKNREWSSQEILHYNLLVRVSRIALRKLTLAGIIAFFGLGITMPVSILLLIFDMVSMSLTKKIARMGIEQAYAEGIFSGQEAQYYHDNCSKFFDEIPVAYEMYRVSEERGYMVHR